LVLPAFQFETTKRLRRALGPESGIEIPAAGTPIPPIGFNATAKSLSYSRWENSTGLEPVLLVSDGRVGRHTSVIRQDQSIEINGYSVPMGGGVIHFYYNKAEQQRLLGFLLEGAARREGVVMACAENASEALSDGLEMLGVRRSEHEIIEVEITSNVRASLDAIAAAAKDALGRDHRYCSRVLCDFGSMIGQEAIFELEGSLNSALAGLNLVLVTQYDGRGFGAPITIEQFHTHALAIVGNAFFRENRHYAPPEAHFRKRGAGGRK